VTNSRQKGKRGELEAAKYLRSLGFTSARRGVQYSGGPDSPDVVCDELPGVHIEVKYGVKGLDLGTQLWKDACEQSIREAVGMSWCVLWKPHRCEQWRLTFPGQTSRRWLTASINGDIKGALLSLRGMAQVAA
jgi:Holliday junction resolvase